MHHRLSLHPSSPTRRCGSPRPFYIPFPTKLFVPDRYALMVPSSLSHYVVCIAASPNFAMRCLLIRALYPCSPRSNLPPPGHAVDHVPKTHGCLLFLPQKINPHELCGAAAAARHADDPVVCRIMPMALASRLCMQFQQDPEHSVSPSTQTWNLRLNSFAHARHAVGPISTHAAAVVLRSRYFGCSGPA